MQIICVSGKLFTIKSTTLKNCHKINKKLQTGLRWDYYEIASDTMKKKQTNTNASWLVTGVDTLAMAADLLDELALTTSTHVQSHTHILHNKFRKYEYAWDVNIWTSCSLPVQLQKSAQHKTEMQKICTRKQLYYANNDIFIEQQWKIIPCIINRHLYMYIYIEYSKLHRLFLITLNFICGG